VESCIWGLLPEGGSEGPCLGKILRPKKIKLSVFFLFSCSLEIKADKAEVINPNGSPVVVAWLLVSCNQYALMTSTERKNVIFIYLKRKKGM
jgi:hypothetical protein